MKKLFRIATGLLLLAGVLCTLSSCKKDSFSSKDLIGKWQIVRDIERYYVNGKLEDEGISDCDEPWMGLEFRSGGTGVVWNKNYVTKEIQITWTMNKSTLSMVFDGGEEESVEITSLTSDRMVFMVFDEGTTEDGEHWREEEIYEFQKVK